MTRALDRLNAVDEDIGPEKAKPQEPKYVKPTEPVIKEPAKTAPRLLTQALEKARLAKEAREKHQAEERDRLEEALSGSEPDRVELMEQAEAVINAAVQSTEAREAAREIRDLLAAKQELIRNVQQAMGMTTNNLRELGDDVIDRLSKLVGANGLLSELVRDLCAAAGTVRVDEPLLIKREGGKLRIIRQFVDVGDEEPDQDPIVDLKWLVPAALKLKARYSRLLTEHSEAAKRSGALHHQLELAQARAAELERENASLRLNNTTLSMTAKAVMPTAPGSPEGFYLKSDNNRWIGRKDGKGFCFTNRWFTTNNPALAHAFEFKADAEELLQRLQMARVHRIGLRHRETLRVISVRYEDHT
jgi:hypothetical protein